MEIQIDVRETELIALVKHYLTIMPTCKDISLVVKTLPIGDIIMVHEEKEKVVIERKSLADLASSIKDGRYEEQSFRLNGLSIHNHNIIYLVEGDMNKINMFKSRIDKTTLYSVMTSILCYKGFSILRSYNCEETAVMLCNLAYKIRKSESEGRHLFYQNGVVLDAITYDVSKETVTTDEKEYCSVVKRVKKENITKDNIGEIMLCQIPGISSITALAIMDQYKTLPNLVLQLKENKDCLKDTSYTNSTGQIRKISKTVIAKLVEYLIQ